MIGSKFNSISALLLPAVMFFLFIPFFSQAYEPVPVIAEYFDMLETGNFETAQMMWETSCQERATRFGIEYTDIPIRTDCTSPVVYDLDVMRRYLYQPVKQYKEFEHETFVRLEYYQTVDDQPVQHFYYLKRDGDFYWLIYPQDFFAREWPVRETKYFRIHYHPDNLKYLNPVLIEESDRFIETTAGTLKISKADLETLAAKKIEFFFCDADSTVSQITSKTTKGLLDLASNDIISATFPHFHEVTHFLINYKLRRLPLFTLPLLQEGLAVYYGGRWGKKPSALFDLGIFIYREKFVELDSLLTLNGFKNNSSADIAYPLAAVFTSYLMDELGQNKYFELYLAGSGKYRNLKNLTADEVKNRLLSFVGFDDWSVLVADFNRYLDDRLAVLKAAEPGRTEKGSIILEDVHFKISKDKDWLAFEFPGQQGDTLFQGSLFFSRDSRLDGAVCPLFEEQFQGAVAFEGYRYGVRFDRNEAGLYDYGTNELVAKYIWGITPLEGYYDPGANSIYIKFKMAVFGNRAPDFKDFKFFPL